MATPQAQALIGRQEGGASSHAGHQVRQATAVNNGLIGWWKLDNDFNDSSGNGYTGTGVGSYTSATGKFGQAYSFNAGATGYVNVGNVGARPTAGSISFWMNQVSVNNYYNPFTTAGVSPSGGNANNAGIRFEMDATGKFVVAVGNDSPTGTDAAHGLTPHTYLASGMQAGQWYHVVLTWDSSSNTVSGYLNNALKFSESNTTWATNFSSVLLGIGYSSGRYQHGVLDDVRMYNRQLSATDVAQLYAGSQTVACDQTCVGYWKFDSTGTVAAHPGAVSGSPAIVSGKFGNARSYSSSTDTILVTNMTGYDSTSAGQNTLSFWMYWNGVNTGIPICYSGNYCLWITSSYFGFTSFNSDVYGVARAALPTSSWVHIVAVFTNNFSTNFASNQLYINGVSQTLSQQQGTPVNRSAGSVVTIGGNGGNHYVGYLDDVREYNYALSSSDVTSIYTAGGTNVLLNSSLIGYWPLDETSGNVAYDAISGGYYAPDATTNGRFATLTGFTLDGSTNGPAVGLSGNGAMINGSNRYFLVNPIAVTLSTAFTMEAWINPTSTTVASIIQRNGPVFFGYGDPPTGTNAGKLCLNLSTTDGNGWTQKLCGATTLPTNTWTNVIGTWDGTNVKVYVNGKLDGQVARTGTITFTDGAMDIGGGLGNSFPGTLDEVRVYSRVLSDYEIFEHASSGR